MHSRRQRREVSALSAFCQIYCRAFAASDVEERFAKLEAATASRGDRKMFLSIIGQVHRVILWWDDGPSLATLDSTAGGNRPASSRLSFPTSIALQRDRLAFLPLMPRILKISPKVKIGCHSACNGRIRHSHGG